MTTPNPTRQYPHARARRPAMTLTLTWPIQDETIPLDGAQWTWPPTVRVAS